MFKDDNIMEINRREIKMEFAASDLENLEVVYLTWGLKQANISEIQRNRGDYRRYGHVSSIIN